MSPFLTGSGTHHESQRLLPQLVSIATIGRRLNVWWWRRSPLASLRSGLQLLALILAPTSHGARPGPSTAAGHRSGRGWLNEMM